MKVEIFVLQPEKEVQKLIQETRNSENLTLNYYVNRLQVLNTYLSLLPANICPLSTSELHDIIKKNIPQSCRTKYKSADLNSDTILEFTSDFTRLEDLDQKRVKTPYIPNKDSDKSSKMKKIE
jgi:hypothetical protein